MPNAADERAASLVLQGAPSRANVEPKVAGLSLLFGAMYFIQTVGDPTSGLIAQPVRSMLKAWGEDATTIAAFMALLALPWTLKPLLALAADFVPLGGSHRRNPLLLASLMSGVGLLVLAWLPIPEGARMLLLVLLIVPTVGIALGDVLVDALMIEEGQPRGLTGRFQSIQWAAANGALLLAGVLGGYVSQEGAQSYAFLLCAVLWGVSFLAALRFVRDPPRPPSSGRGLRAHAREVKAAFRAPGLRPACVLLFFWSFNPLWQSVLYLHVTEGLGFSEQLFGSSLAVFFGGCMVASLAYAMYCRRVRISTLLHASIAAGICANVLYLHLATEIGLLVASGIAGFAFMTGQLIQLDVAARLVPLTLAATMFATIMALTNLSSSLSEGLGGWLYDIGIARLGEPNAYQAIVVLSLLVSVSCWLWVPALRRQVPAWWQST